MALATRHMIRPEHMNHHGCLYAGTLSEWMTEAALIAVSGALHSTAGMVLAAAKELRISRSMYVGTVLELNYDIFHVGITSITIRVSGQDFLSRESYCSGDFVFVTVDESGHKRPHGLQK